MLWGEGAGRGGRADRDFLVSTHEAASAAALPAWRAACASVRRPVEERLLGTTFAATAVMWAPRAAGPPRLSPPLPPQQVGHGLAASARQPAVQQLLLIASLPPPIHITPAITGGVRPHRRRGQQAVADDGVSASLPCGALAPPGASPGSAALRRRRERLVRRRPEQAPQPGPAQPPPGRARVARRAAARAAHCGRAAAAAPTLLYPPCVSRCTSTVRPLPLLTPSPSRCAFVPLPRPAGAPTLRPAPVCCRRPGSVTEH